MTLSLSLATFCRSNSLFSLSFHSILFSITCTFRRRKNYDEQKAVLVV